MKSHDLAKALVQLAKLLQAGPNVELTDIDVVLGSRKRVPTKGEVAVNLATLVSLSRIDRGHWIRLIDEFGFPISVRPRDASRDILGKVLRCLEENPEARARLGPTGSRSSKASPELMAALGSLLREEP